MVNKVGPYCFLTWYFSQSGDQRWKGFLDLLLMDFVFSYKLSSEMKFVFLGAEGA